MLAWSVPIRAAARKSGPAVRHRSRFATQLSNCIGIDKEKLVFNPMHIGGDFGGKGGFMDVPVAYFLSLKSGQPVKMVMDYGEELTAGNPRHASIIRAKTGVKKDGAIVAHHLDFIFDSGAYGSMKPAGYLIGASTCAGPYKIANCLIEERMVYTNKIPCGHMRAPGDPQGFFANESQMDIVCAQARHGSGRVQAQKYDA